MTVKTNRQGTVALVDVEGHLVAGEDLTALQALTGEATRHATERVVVNFAKVGRLDCAGIGALAGLCGALRESAVALTLIEVAPRHARLLELAGLFQVMHVRPREERRAASFFRSAHGSGRVVVAATF